MSDVPRDPGATDELDSLLGAYALDALDADDRARVEAYLERDVAARAEVDEMHETAAALAMVPVTADGRAAGALGTHRGCDRGRTRRGNRCRARRSRTERGRARPE